MSARVKILLSLCAVAITAALAAVPASAEPILDLQLIRTKAPVTHSDERLAYELEVTNSASQIPSVGDQLSCGNVISQFGTPSPTIEVEWLRNGTPIPGSKGPLATAKTYTLVAADEGKLLQCLVTATNDPDGALGTGSAYAPLTFSQVSLPPVAVATVPSPAPPSGTSRPSLTGPAMATPSGTATTAAGSKILTDVITARGSGDLTLGSQTIANVATTSGTFISESFFKQTITGPGIASATFTGSTEKGQKTIKAVTTTSGALVVGQIVTGPGLPQNSRIVKVSAGEVELSATATATIAAFAFHADTEITAVDPGAHTLTISLPATASGAGTELAAGAFPFAVGQTMSGAGIPAGATIADASTGGAGFVELSATATASASGVAITGTSVVACNAPTWSGTGNVWSLQWLRNGVPIPGATSSTYTVQSADTDPPSILQCEATVRDAAGNEAVSLSGQTPTSPRPPAPYWPPSLEVPAVARPNSTEGAVTVEAELPLGTKPFRVVGNGWSCVKAPPVQPSSAKCQRADTLESGASFPPITLVAQIAADAPDSLTTRASAFGGTAANLPLAEDTVAGILPALPFGFKAFETGVLDELGGDFNQAGGHPFSVAATIKFNEHVKVEEILGNVGLRAGVGSVREIRTEAPAGFTGNPLATGEKCQRVADVLALPSGCPAASVVGGITLETSISNFVNQPIYAIEPERGTPAQFAFGVAALSPGFAYTLTPELRPGDNYAISLVTAPIQKVPELFEAKATLCKFGGNIGADPNKVIQGGESIFLGCRKAGEPGAPEEPFISLPTRCNDPASTLTRIFADTWEKPGEYASAQFSAPELEGCNALQFEPSLKARPTNSAADSPTGLEVDLNIPQNQDPEGTATAQLDKTVVTLPEGLVINPSAANGLGACSSAQIGLGDNNPVQCPDNSKVGTVLAQTPILPAPLPGTLYIAAPHDNPFDSLLALYLVIEDPKTGITIKLAGQVTPDPQTGRLTTTFDQNPQAPVSDVKLAIRSGANAPLRTPATCGRYSTTSALTPWSAPESGPPATPKDTYQINKGPNGSPCPTSEAALPNAPAFEAGTASPLAATYSPFVLKLRREDGSQGFSAIAVSPPPGLVAKLAGTATCPDSALASAESKSGKAEQADPSCPAASRVGSVVAAAGAGPAPYYAPGTAYLTGPYKNAPLSLAIVTPAVAGPFDIGTVVVRTALYLDPTTAQVTAKSDPLPTILQGIPLDIRAATVSLDRPDFTLNPTSCDPMAVSGSLLSTQGNSAALNNRFQVAECTRLAFKPKLALRLHGPTKRGKNPRLSATLTYPQGGGYANVASAAVTLPHSSFLAQEHIRTICTRVQFAAHTCPAGSIYGRATATTPLLDQPLTGPVYLRSSSNPLPDLVVALKGPDSIPIEVELAGRVDSKNGGIRNSFEVVPDAPVSKFTLEMQGGRKSLIVNSRDLCKGPPQRATVRLGAQNGMTRDFRPVVANDCKKARKGKKHKGAKKKQSAKPGAHR